MKPKQTLLLVVSNGWHFIILITDSRISYQIATKMNSNYIVQPCRTLAILRNLLTVFFAKKTTWCFIDGYKELIG